jgi:hypothetical protein
MEQSGRNRWQMPSPEIPGNGPKPVAVGCNRVPIGAHSKEGSTVRVRQRASRKRLQMTISCACIANGRGLCCLAPGVHGLTESVRVRSIIGRFLEHSRIYHLRRSARGEFLIGSADWMHRNLSERVEAVVPISERRLRRGSGRCSRRA